MRNQKEIKKYLPRILSATMAVTLMCSVIGTTAYSAGTEQTQPAAAAEQAPSAAAPAAAPTSDRFSKEETVYVIADANGAPKKVIVSDWIQNPGKAEKVADKSNLSDIETTKGDETYTLDEQKMVEWNAGGKDIYYQGVSDVPLPVGVSVQYLLDGKAIAPAELAGKSGRLKMVFTYQNRQYEEVKIGGKTEKIYVPFVMMTGMMLDSERFTNVTVSNGKVLNDGSHTYVAGFALPGVQETLGIDKAQLELPATVEITADVQDFELATTLTVATNDLFGDIDVSKLDGKVTELKDKLKELTGGVDKLADGSSQLYQGLSTLLNKSGDLIDGVQQLFNGAAQLRDGSGALSSGAGDVANGAAALNDGAGTLQNGVLSLDAGAGDLQGGAGAVDSGVATLQGYIGTLASGLSTISSNSSTLTGGAKQVFDTFLAEADKQLAAAGVTAEPLTVDTYAEVLNGLLKTLSAEAVHQRACDTARATVSATVNSQREVIAQAVEAQVRKQVTDGVLAAAGLDMDSDTYAAAVAAGQIAEDVQAQISAGVAAQMTQMADVIAANTETQITALIDSNMQSEEVQAQIAQAEAQAAGGRQALESLKAQLDSYNTFYQGVIAYTNGVNQANSGAQEILNGTFSLKDGTAGLAGGAAQLKTGTAQLKTGAGTLKDGAGALKTGTDALKTGADTLTFGAVSLFDGVAALLNGTGTLTDGVTKLQTGAQQLDGGMEKLKKEGTGALVKAVNGDLKSLTDRLKAMVNASKHYQSFSGTADHTDGKVNFVFKTDAVKSDAASKKK